MKKERKKTSFQLLKKDVKKLLEKGISEGVFPCAAAGISCGLGKERKKIIVYCGNAALFPEKRGLKKNNFFDLASLTKPLATTMAILCLLKEEKITLEDKLPALIEEKITGNKRKITIMNLLGHCSGLPAYREYFRVLKEVKKSERSKFVEKLILQEKLEYEPEKAAIYSDLGFILLGRIIEKKTGCTLAHYVEEKVLRPLGLQKKIFYNPLNDSPKKDKQIDFVATEDSAWRKKTLCGEVHDDNCYTLGGVAGHSGLFGNIEGVTDYAGIILDLWKGVANHPHIEKEDLISFLARQQQIPGSTWALGFDTPSTKESSSGIYLSQNSIGHLGFTGTSFWIDPERNFVMVLLSNRVHPSRENIKIKRFRPSFHNQIMEKLL